MTDKEILIEKIQRKCRECVEYKCTAEAVFGEIFDLVVDYSNIFSAGCPAIAKAPACAAFEAYAEILRGQLGKEEKELYEALRKKASITGIGYSI